MGLPKKVLPDKLAIVKICLKKLRKQNLFLRFLVLSVFFVLFYSITFQFKNPVGGKKNIGIISSNPTQMLDLQQQKKSIFIQKLYETTT